MRILIIDAITDLHIIDWTKVPTKRQVQIEFELLPDFNLHFETGNIQKALVNSKDRLQKRIQEFNPNLVIVDSKGVCIISFMIVEKIYCGPAVILSPIINYCDHIKPVFETDVDHFWSRIHDILSSTKSKYAFGVGSSIDETELILSDIQDMCQKEDWPLLVCPGDHDWILDNRNWDKIGSLIDIMN